MAFGCDILTLFPAMIRAYASESILGKALGRGLLELDVTDIRDFAAGKHHVTDDAPYGGGAGMVMKPEPLVGAIEAAQAKRPRAPVILLSPRGAPFTQRVASDLAHRESMILVCGRYEGVDERAMIAIDEEISLGDFILTGGELGALCLLDSVARLLPGVLGNSESLSAESFESGLLEYPQYTRPAEFRGMAVPAVLQSGDHARIARWRRWHSLRVTQARRPDLFARFEPSKADLALMKMEEADL